MNSSVNLHRKGFKGQREFYIATQGPTEATTNDFWRAIYEKNVSVIVMVTSLQERGKVGPFCCTTHSSYWKNFSLIQSKCFKYWPSRGQGNYGEISVTFASELNESSFTNRWFHITYVSGSTLIAVNNWVGCTLQANETRTVLQMYFTNWPDFGCPEDPADMIQFIMAARSNNESQGGKAPILVHCRSIIW